MPRDDLSWNISPCLRRISVLEQRYIRVLAVPSPDHAVCLDQVRGLELAYRRLTTFVRDLHRDLSQGPGGLQALTERYLAEAQEIHQQNISWLSYGIRLREPLHPRKPDSRIPAFLRRMMPQRSVIAPDDPVPPATGPERTRTMAILSLKKQRDQEPVNSYLWRSLNRRLCRRTADLTVSILNENRRKLRDGFQKHTAVFLTDLEEPGPAGKDAAQDWVSGYRRTAPPSRSDRLSHELTARLSHFIIRRIFLDGLKAFGVTVTAIILLFLAHETRLDIRLYEGLVSLVKTVLQQDAGSVRNKHKKDFFYQHILEIEGTYKPEDLTARLRDFREQELHKTTEGHWYFAEHILRPFFPLLSDGRLDAGVLQEVVEISGLLGPEVQAPLMRIVRFFGSTTMRESQLRKEMLNLRRAFISHDVFPFTFIVLREEAPYFFVFPEKIHKKFFFPLETLTTLGLNAEHYAKHTEFPLTAHVVTGDQYPFKERAGYFEGEYAVVFSGMAPQADWTAWHETAHMIDQMRYKHGGVPYPKNIELNAVLFPAIFADNAQSYLLNRVLPIIRAADPDDYYVQAAKGLLNGLALSAAEENGLSLGTVSDDFEPDRIAGIETFIRGLDDATVRAVALKMYKDPKKYLATAKSGRYKGVIGNAEEVEYGTSGPPPQGFMLTGYDKGGWASLFGPRFIRDGTGEDDDVYDEDFFSTLARIIDMIFRPGSYAGGGFGKERVIASVITFILVECFFILVALLSSPLRKRKFRGRAPQEIVDNIYARHPWTDGLSRGGELGEKDLLNQLFSASGGPDDTLRAQTEAFKKTVDDRRRLLFDICLTLAPLAPQRSRVSARWHNFLFWVPFIGPVIARSSWLLPKQISFEDRETYNRAIEDLVKNVTAHTDPEILRQRYLDLIQPYKAPAILSPSGEGVLSPALDNIEKLLFSYLNQTSRNIRPRQPLRRYSQPRSTHETLEFERLDNYSFGDDIKRIDWNATARSAHSDAKVRRYSGAMGARTGFLIDFRDLSARGQDKIAKDFVSALRTLGENGEVKRLILVMPDGEVLERDLNRRDLYSLFLWADGIWAAVEDMFQEYENALARRALHGLRFYTDDENAVFLRTAELTDLHHPSADADPKDKISANHLNIFLIGVKMEQRRQIEDLLPAGRESYIWP